MLNLDEWNSLQPHLTAAPTIVASPKCNFLLMEYSNRLKKVTQLQRYLRDKSRKRGGYTPEHPRFHRILERLERSKSAIERKIETIFHPRNRRFQFKGQVTLKHQKRRSTGEVIDISRTGLFVAMRKNPLQISDTVEVEIIPHGSAHVLRTIAEVVRITNRNPGKATSGYGLRFIR